MIAFDLKEEAKQSSYSPRKFRSHNIYKNRKKKNDNGLPEATYKQRRTTIFTSNPNTNPTETQDARVTQTMVMKYKKSLGVKYNREGKSMLVQFEGGMAETPTSNHRILTPKEVCVFWCGIYDYCFGVFLCCCKKPPLFFFYTFCYA